MLTAGPSFTFPLVLSWPGAEVVGELIAAFAVDDVAVTAVAEEPVDDAAAVIVTDFGRRGMETTGLAAVRPLTFFNEKFPSFFVISIPPLEPPAGVGAAAGAAGLATDEFGLGTGVILVLLAVSSLVAVDVTAVEVAVVTAGAAPPPGLFMGMQTKALLEPPLEDTANAGPVPLTGVAMVLEEIPLAKIEELEEEVAGEENDLLKPLEESSLSSSSSVYPDP